MGQTLASCAGGPAAPPPAPTESGPLSEKMIGKSAAADSEAPEPPSSFGGRLKERFINFFSTLTGKTALRLIVPTLAFVGFIAISTAIYHRLEGWSVNECIYFCVVVITSVGYGDLSPLTRPGKIYTIFFIFLSFTIVLSAFGLILAEISDHASRAKGNVMKVLRNRGLKTDVRLLKKLENERLASAQRHLIEIAQLVGITAATLGAGAIFVYLDEGWDTLDCIYWAVVTLSTVGFGDLSPTKDETRILMTIYILFAVTIFASTVGKLMSVCLDWYSEHRLSKLFEHGLTESLIEELELDGDGSIERYEFVAYMLAEMGKVSTDDIERIMVLFNELDADGSGKLDVEDIRAHQEMNQKMTTAETKADRAA